jgi:hypothetical protein
MRGNIIKLVLLWGYYPLHPAIVDDVETLVGAHPFSASSGQYRAFERNPVSCRIREMG